MLSRSPLIIVLLVGVQCSAQQRPGVEPPMQDWTTTLSPQQITGRAAPTMWSNNARLFAGLRNEAEAIRTVLFDVGECSTPSCRRQLRKTRLLANDLSRNIESSLRKKDWRKVEARARQVQAVWPHGFTEQLDTSRHLATAVTSYFNRIVQGPVNASSLAAASTIRSDIAVQAILCATHARASARNLRS
jgi:hypothetical protein